MLLYYVHLLYSLGGGRCNLYPLVCRSGSVLCPIRSCLMVISFRLLVWLNPSAPMYLRGSVGWGHRLVSVSPKKLTWRGWTRSCFPTAVAGHWYCVPEPLTLECTGVWPAQSDGDPTLDVSACPRVRLAPLFCEASGYPFKGIWSLHTK